jgi:hypothetical protein
MNMNKPQNHRKKYPSWLPSIDVVFLNDGLVVQAA